MTWQETCPVSRQPDMEEISKFAGGEYWSRLCSWLEKTYLVSPRIEYSRCSMQGGWNVKYKKGSRPVCTLYPEDGFFICMISIGAKEAAEAELVLQGCTPYVQELYSNTNPFNGGRWLMVQVRDDKVLEDVKELIEVRMKRKR